MARTLRAADELRVDLEALAAAELPGLTVRIGIATGEVIAESARNVWGDPLIEPSGWPRPRRTARSSSATQRDALPCLARRACARRNGVAALGLAARRPVALTIHGPMVGRDEELGHARATFNRTRPRARRIS